METHAPKAVFLSYASQDAGAARRISEVLRAAGVEVWFDQSELRGGDAWDTKIRKQIQECALFLPVISENTQVRGEGYFRLEWLLAVERSRLMADDQPFLLPIVIDATLDATARVPDRFRAVQWTRFSGGETSAAFCERVRRLLSEDLFGTDGLGAASARPAKESAGHRVPTVAWGVGLAVAAAIIVGGFLATRQPPSTALGTRPMSVETPPATPKARSIAVLPFENLSADKDNAFFADGMHDEVITALTKIHDLTVTSRTSVMVYRNTPSRNLRKIAAELGVANVLEGSVQRTSDKVKVNVQLIDARTDAHLWADKFTEELADVFAIQEKIATAITTALKATFSPEERTLLARRPTRSQEAYDLYLRARVLDEQLGGMFSREEGDRIVLLYEQAIEKDPAFAQAYAQLVLTHGHLYYYGFLDPTPARRARAQAAMEAAVRLAPSEPETHFAVGMYSYRCENDWIRALNEFRIAAAALPGDVQVLVAVGGAQRRLGQLSAALETLTRSCELNPHDKLSRAQRFWTLAWLHRYADMASIGRSYPAQFPNDVDLLRLLAQAQFELTGDRNAFFRAMEVVPPEPVDSHSLVKQYRLALLRGDLHSAEQALVDSRFPFIDSSGGVIAEPAVLHRALVAFLREERVAAGSLAKEAIRWFRTQTWTRRQEAGAMVSEALAQALAGQADEAVRLASGGFKLLKERDALDAMAYRADVARVFLILNRPDDAFGLLREMMTGPGLLGPQQVRLDPLWSRLKDDPRFEAILRLAKPL